MDEQVDRRRLISGFGVAATAMALGGGAAAQAPAPFTPERHDRDSWLGTLKGKHRVVLDVTSPDGVPDAIRFAGNLFTGHQTGYGLSDSDIAIVICFRHGATPFGYANSLWSKHGARLDAKASPAPTANPFDSGDRVQLTPLTKRGVHIMVCGTASRGISRRLVGETGDADAMLREMEQQHLLPNARIVPAGVVGVTHAQEYGYSLLYVG